MQIVQNFFDGINRAVSREEFFNPREFHSLTNARILESGNLGEIVRIKGFSQINALADLATVYDMALVNNSSVGTENLYLIFYKNTANTYTIKILDTDGTQVASFTYSSDIEPTNGGELKQHENTIFVSPHNKLIYGVNSNFFIKDFISNIPKITSIVNDDSGARATTAITINQGLSGYGGSKSQGRISFGGGLTSSLIYNFRIVIDGVESNEIKGSFSSETKLLEATYNALNTTPALTSVWDFNNVVVTDLEGLVDTTRFIQITSREEGAEFNVPIELRNGQPNPENGNNAGQATYKNITRGDIGSRNRTPITFFFYDMVGGTDPNNVFGSVRISLKDANVTQPIEITDTDTPITIATKLESILNKSRKIVDLYTVGRIGATVTVQAKLQGVEYTTDLILTVNDGTSRPINLPNDFYTVTIGQGADAIPTGTIEANTHYWYKARFRYVDGHITKTCPENLVYTKGSNLVTVNFEITDVDLDDTLPRLQVFRKKEGGEFFLIHEVNLNNATVIADTFGFVDIGYGEIETYADVENVWTKSHNTQEVMDNRYIKGNIKLFDENVTINPTQFTLSTLQPDDAGYDSTNRDVAPYNSKLTVYAQPQYTDGSLGYFNNVGTLDIDGQDEIPLIQQTTLIPSSEKTISELKFFGNYLPFGERKNLRFTTPEIITPNLESIEDPLLFSTTAKLFFGYKYILTKFNVIYTAVQGWTKNSEDGLRKIGEIGNNGAEIKTDNGYPKLFINIHGSRVSYIPYAVYVDGSVLGDNIAWKLESYDALQEAVSTGELKIQLKDTNIDGLSNTTNDDELTNIQVTVTSIEDFSENDGGKFNLFTYNGLLNTSIKWLVPPKDNRLYLTLERSLLDEIDKSKLNSSSFSVNETVVGGFSDLAVRVTGSLGFEILNFEKETDAVVDVTIKATQHGEEDSFEVYTEVDPAKYSLINRKLNVDNTAIYFGSKLNQVDVSPVLLDTTGFRYRTRSSLFYSTLTPYNIYEKIVKESDFNFVRQDFANQIIWSSPLQDANYFSGGRNFAYTNFYNVPTENGQIIDIFSLAGNLYVFCEKGVARLLVGETLTQQKSGQLFVDSTNFITKHLWMMENMSPIKKGSIAKYEGSLYFTDGTDVYRVGGDGVENISLGVLNLTESDNYVGTIVKKYDEYRLANLTTGETFVYNTKFKKWYGPHTYTPKKTVEIGGAIVSYDDALIKEDVGNTFAGTSYMTVIQSVGNDTETGAIDKTYRKFYISMDGDKTNGYMNNTTLKYGKDFTNLESVSMDDATKVRIKNNKYNVGIKNSKGNSKKIYWDVETTNDGFRLKGFRTAYMFRRRR